MAPTYRRRHIEAFKASLAEGGWLEGRNLHIDYHSLAADALQSNMEILKERPSFEIQVVLSDGRRAILTLEKGPSGGSIFAEAFAG
jgi:hypothetical protein